MSEELDLLNIYENELKWFNTASVNSIKTFESLTIIDDRNNRLIKLLIRIAEIKLDLPRCNKYSWKNYDLHKTIDEAKVIFSLLKSSLFLLSDIDRYK